MPDITFRLRNTDIAGRRPSTAILTEGEVLVNRNVTNPGAFLNAQGSVHKIGSIHVGPTFPALLDETSTPITPSLGELWFKDDTAELMLWNGVMWISIVSTSGGGSYVEVLFNTGPINTGQAIELDVQISRLYALLQVETNAAAVVRLYTTSAYQTADAARPIGAAPTGEHGLSAEIETTAGNLEFDCNPWVLGGNSETPNVPDIPVTVINTSGINQPAGIDVILRVVKINDTGFAPLPPGVVTIYSVNREVISANKALSDMSPNYHFLDTGGGAYDVVLPNAPVDGMNFHIKNIGTVAGDITLKEFGGATLATIPIGQQATVVYDSVEWQEI